MSSRLSLEAKKLRVAEIIRSSPTGASSALSSLDLTIELREQNRPCDSCGRRFKPKTKPLARFCCQRCSTRFWMRFPEHRKKIFTVDRNAKCGAARKAFLNSGSPEAQRQIECIRRLTPSVSPIVQRKISAALKSKRHKPPIQGGNGKATPIPQSRLHTVLGPEWELEHVVRTKIKEPGVPYCYKIDIANPTKMIAIEVDGPSHSSLRAQDKDRRKTQILTSFGWKVLRFSNSQILDWIDAGMPMESFISTTFKQLSIPLLPLHPAF